MKRVILVLSLMLLWPSPANSQPTPEPPKAEAKAVPSSGPTTSLATPVAAPTGATTTPAPTEPKTLPEAVEVGKTAVAVAQAGQWWYFSSLVCLVLMFVLKSVKVLEKIGRWKYIILPVLSLAAALLAAFQGGVGLATAIGVFSSSWAAGMLEELVNHGILGKAHETVKPA